jgi:ribosomal peptide maturation radical SAM protein 1
MPWHLLELPSLALGILEQVALRAVPGARVSLNYANISWADYLFRATDGEVKPDLYNRIAQEGIGCSLGDWIFAPALRNEPWRDDAFSDYLPDADSWPLDQLFLLRRLAPDFIKNLASEIIKDEVKVVGLTTTFTQNIPALSLAKQLKTISPGIKIIFGGANCDGPQGAALHREFPFVDFVIRGEGESSFPLLLKAISLGEGEPDIPGLCYRNPGGESVADERHPPLTRMDEVPTPRFTTYRERVDSSAIRRFLRPKVVVESSRGCWWGEKHHCTFCGLNGATMKFRSKQPEAVVKEIESAAHDCHSLDVFTVDNILDPHYLNTLMPLLAREPYDYCLHYEIKANLNLAQLCKLREGRVFHVQPGIESLITPVLREMRKGITGWQNVRCLRDCETVGLTVTWNLLYGFPGERREDYEEMLSQLPALFHLPPPAEVVRFSIQRFSPYHDDPELGFAGATPAPVFERIYQLSRDRLDDLVYLFSAPYRGISEECAARMRAAVEEWRGAYAESVLRVEKTERGIHVYDTRPLGAESSYLIEDPALVHSYQILRGGGTINNLTAELRKRLGPLMTEGKVRAAVDELEHLGLVFRSDEAYISLGTELSFYQGCR